MYGTMGWQGSQAYNSSAKSAHEAKMAAVLAGFRGLPQGLFFLLVPVIIYVFMNHADYAPVAESVKAASDIYAPVSGEIVEVNDKLEESPELINESPYDFGWMVVMIPDNKLENTLDSKSYRELID